MRPARLQSTGHLLRSPRSVGVAASILVHLALLAGLAFGARSLYATHWAALNDIQVELIRLKPPEPRPQQPAKAAAPLQAAPQLKVHEAKSPPPPAAPTPFLVPPAPPRPAPAAVPPAPQAESRAPLLGLGTAMQKVLGCRDTAGMTEAQRAACNRRMGEDVATTKPLPLMIPPEKKAAWDKEMWKRRRPQGPPMVLCGGPGSNFNFSCIPDNPRWKPGDDGSDQR